MQEGPDAVPGLPLALLGECTLVPGFVAGALRRHPGACLVWVDAHGDLDLGWPRRSPGSLATRP